MKGYWIVLLVAVLLFWWTRREHFGYYTNGVFSTTPPPDTRTTEQKTADKAAADASPKYSDILKEMEAGNSKSKPADVEDKPGKDKPVEKTDDPTKHIQNQKLTKHSVKGRNVFGPDSGGVVAGPDEKGYQSLSRLYPSLLGPNDGSNANSKYGKGYVPSDGSLGVDDNSRFFPTSRVPGDMDSVPNPNIVSSSYTAASGSSKTDPVPYLTDFSAFAK